MPLAQENLEELRERLAPDLRILMIAVSDAWGGLEQTTFADARALVELGMQVVVLCRKGSPLDEHCKMSSTPMEVEYFTLPVRRLFDLALMRRIRQVVKQRKINLLHTHQGSLINSIVPALAGNPEIGLVLSRHILNDHNKKDLLHAVLYRRVDYILVLSNAMKRNLLTTFPVQEKKLRIVNLGLDLGAFDPSRASKTRMRSVWGISEDRFLVGVVGRLDPMKCQDLVIKALANLQHEIPHMHLVIVGAETPGLKGVYLESLQKAIRELRLEGKVSIVGPETRIPEVMAALDLFVMPSQEEAFGLVALEAMAMGIPAALSRAGSSEELAARGRATLFRPGDAFDLTKKIRTLYGDPAGRAKAAALARDYVLANYSYDQRLRQTLDVYMRCGRRRNLLQSTQLYGIKTATL